MSHPCGVASSPLIPVPAPGIPQSIRCDVLFSERLHSAPVPLTRFVQIVIAALACGAAALSVPTLYELDKTALMDLYSYTNGYSWTTATNWKRGDPCDAAYPWFGITCVWDDLYGRFRVSQIVLPSNNLKGHLRPSIGLLAKLTVLELHNNALSSSLPNSLGKLALATTINLSQNFISGPLLPSLGGLSSIQSLNLGTNLLTGTLPVQLWWLNTLTCAPPVPLLLLPCLLLPMLPAPPPPSPHSSLKLNNNLLIGNVQRSLGTLSRLTTLSLAHNKLTQGNVRHCGCDV